MKSSTKHPKDISTWLSKIHLHIQALESGIHLLPQIYQHPERYIEYSEFVNLYENWLDLNQEEYLFLSDEYSISALQLMSKLSNTESSFQAWYEIAQSANVFLSNNSKEKVLKMSLNYRGRRVTAR